MSNGERIGVAVGSNSVRAVGVRGSEVRWALEGTYDEAGSLASALTDLLRQIPRRRRLGRPGVVVAIGPCHAQTKRLDGLPDLHDQATLARIVTEGQGRFFLRNGVPLVCATPQRDERGALWGAAFEAPVLDAVAAACRAARIEFVAAVPTASAIAATTGASTFSWGDGLVRLDVTRDGPALLEVRRLARDADAEGLRAPDEMAPALARLGADGWRFADAYGASVVDWRATAAYTPGAASTRLVGRPRIRLAAALAFASASLMVSALVPPLLAERRAARAVASLAALGARRTEGAAIERTNAQLRAALDHVLAFDRGAPSMTLLLARITSALPTTAIVVAFRVDSGGGTLVALAPRAAPVLSALESVPGIVAPEIIGPVTRESMGGRELERLTVRYRVASVAKETSR